jgi:hypothetical protein
MSQNKNQEDTISQSKLSYKNYKHIFKNELKFDDFQISKQSGSSINKYMPAKNWI